MTTRTGLTLDQFLCQPETKPASEYIDGEVIQKPMPDGEHGLLQSFLIEVLRAFLRRTQLGVAIPEWRCIFGPIGNERAFVPDIGVALRASLRPESRGVGGHLLGPPDLAIEVLSPGQSVAEFADKLQFYLLHGVRLVWVFDPDQESVRVFAPGEDPRLLSGEDVLDGGAVLPGLTLTVGELFADMHAWLEMMQP